MRARTLSLLICAAAFSTPSTAQVPSLLKDINPTGNSNVIHLTCFGDVVYFNATDGVHGAELWRTDGTESGTVMVKDMNVGLGSGSPANFMEFNGMLHFTATDGVNGVQLWRTDGTESGTQPVLSIAEVDGLLEWLYFAPLGDRIFFRGRDAVAGSELWSTDGTAAGTELFLDINPGLVNSSIQDPMVHDGMLYFKASNATYGPEPWISDGTVAGTHMIKDIISGSAGSDPSIFAPTGGLVFFRAGTPATGDELWATDGTEAGTGLVRDIYPGTNSSLPSYLIEHNGQLHLRAFPTAGSSTALIWQSDGTQAGTVSLPTFGYTNPDNLCSHNGSLYITAIGASTYRQLWRTDGSAAGTQEILFPGSDVLSPFSNATAMLSCNGDLFFRANYTTTVGQELYTLGLSTGIEEGAKDIIQLYPNPATDKVWIDIGEASTGTATVIARDLLGRAIPLPGPISPDGAGRYLIQLGGMAPGTYLLDLTVGEKRWSRRIVKA